MSGFHDVRLDLPIAIGATGGPERLVEVVRLASGAERRNARWATSRRRWELGGATLTLVQAQVLTAFFEARSGRLNGFRLYDPLDHKSCAPDGAVSSSDQLLGSGDGMARVFQLAKRYESGGETYVRRITRAVAGTVLVSVGGAETTAFEVDGETGEVTLDEAPALGAEVRAGYEFDVPVRFDSDRLEMSFEGADAVRVVRAPIVEIDG
ncbi:MAG: DUF2460 domain-containing protein [Hyphomonadaceae bacterium]